MRNTVLKLRRVLFQLGLSNLAYSSCSNKFVLQFLSHYKEEEAINE